MSQARKLMGYSEKFIIQEADNHTLFPDYKSYETMDEFAKNYVAGKEQLQYNHSS